MRPVDRNLAEFKEMIVPHPQKDKSEWEFYETCKEWNAKPWSKKPLSEFLKFMNGYSRTFFIFLITRLTFFRSATHINFKINLCFYV